MKYNHFEIDEMLSNMIIIYDTREQDTPALHKRLEGFGCPSERIKLDYGDYSCKTIDPSGEEINLSNVSVVERKMNLDELCNCFTKGRQRFENEFKRAISDNAKVHLLVEEGNYEKMFNGSYRSRLNPDALIASYLAWAERYNIQLHFCHKETTPRLIYKIMYYALKCHLEKFGGDCPS
jgi:ERCC4-type nuclease